MKLKIVNKRKFIRVNVCVFILLMIVILSFTNSTSSTTDVHYKICYVLEGETLWDIATKEAVRNNYYEGSDIRDIVQDLKQINKLTDANIVVGEQLKIPNFQ